MQESYYATVPDMGVGSGGQEGRGPPPGFSYMGINVFFLFFFFFFRSPPPPPTEKA